MPARAVTDWELGLGVLGGFNSQVAPPPPTPIEDTTSEPPPGIPAMTLSVTPWFKLELEKSRVVQSLRLQSQLDGLLLVNTAQTGLSYQNSATSLTRIDLSPRTNLQLLVAGYQGRINSLSIAADPSLGQAQAVYLRDIDFMAVSASSNLTWEPTARVRVLHQINYRTYIPYGELSYQPIPVDPALTPDPTGDADGDQVPNAQDRCPTIAYSSEFDPRVTTSTSTDRDRIGCPDAVAQNATQALQSHSLDTALGMMYQWPRFSLGPELRVGWFLPQGGIGARTDSNRSNVVGSLVGRFQWDLTPRWRSDGYVGVFVGTRVDDFFGPVREIQQSNAQTGERSTVQLQRSIVSPIGQAQLSYLFPKVEAGLGLSYQHAASGDVFLGRITVSDDVSLRAYLPLPREVIVSGSVGYRFSRLANNGGFSGTRVAIDDNGQMITTPLGQDYHVVQAGAAATWSFRSYLRFFARYQFLLQRATGLVAIDQFFRVGPVDRHIVMVGLGFVYPPKS